MQATRLESVASLLERQITGGQPVEEGPSQRLLSSPSLDSMGGLRSTGTATPEHQETWHLRDALQASGLDTRDARTAQVASPFAAAAQTPLQETVIVTETAQIRTLVQPGNQRFMAGANSRNLRDAAERWKGESTLLLLWMAAGGATLLMSYPWFQLGVWGGVFGCFGALFSVFGSCWGIKFHINLQVTRIIAIAAGMLSVLAVALWTFLLLGLPCPKSAREGGYCTLFRTALGAMAVWHLMHLGIVGIVAARATRIKALIDPVVRTNVIVLRRSRSIPA